MSDAPTSDLTITGGVLHLPGGRVHHVRPDGRVDIPADLCHLPVDTATGVAIPWTAPLKGDGSGQIDEEAMHRRITQAFEHNLCGVCSFDLEYRKCFHVDEPDEAAARARRLMLTPAMHLTCSAYAAAAFGAETDTEHTWWRYHCRDYRLLVDGAYRAARAAPATRIERLSP